MRHVPVLVVAASALMLAGSASDAWACGAYFPSTSQSADVVSDHRMIFRITQQETTLYDEIEYQGDPGAFAWVLPVHGAVTVGLSSDVVFAAFDAVTATTIVSPSYYCGGCGSSSGGEMGGSSGGGGPPVNVISQQTIGPYDTVQLQSSDPTALTTWLTANGYAIAPSAQPIIAAYVSAGFDFLALKLAPGQGVGAMRPVRVTSMGAGLSLPLRMVAVGSGATVGVTLWIIGDGRYEPANFPSFVINPSDLVWDWNTMSSNYTTVQSQKEAATNHAAWQIESSMQVSPAMVEQPILADPASQDYLDIPGDDAGADGGSGESADQVRDDDLATLFPGGGATVWVTRMRADLSLTALANDLTLQASADQSAISNEYVVTNQINTPVCGGCGDPGYDPDGGSGSGGSGSGSSGGTGGGLFGLGGTSTSSKGGGCSTTNDPAAATVPEVVALVGLLLVSRLRPRRRSTPDVQRPVRRSR